MSRDLESLKASIIEAIDVVSFYNSYLQERLPPAARNGWTERVKCPIHHDQNTPNFFVNVKSGGYKCHSCGASGSIFDFWMLMNGHSLEDRTALKASIAAVASVAGIDISDWSSAESVKKRAEDPVLKVKREQAAKDEEELRRTFIPKENLADTIDSRRKPIPVETINMLRQQLNSEHVNFLLRKRGLRKKAIEFFNILWDKNAPGKDVETEQWFRGKIGIPVKNIKSDFCNIRLYSSRVGNAFKMCNLVIDKDGPNEVKYGVPPRLLNLNLLVGGIVYNTNLAIKPKNIVICEGEWDAILLNQELWEGGYNDWLAVTGTHGAKTFLAEWVQFFFDCNVYICLDCDEEGKLAATTIASKHLLGPLQAKKIQSLKMIILPLSGEKDDKDVTDYFLKAKATVADFVNLCTTTPEMISGGLDNDEATIDAIEVSSFVEAIKNREFIDKKIRVPLTISGATSRIYHAIRKYKVKYCPKMATGDCCSQKAGEQIIPYGHTNYIASCMQRTSVNLAAISSFACCEHEKVTIEPLKSVVMEEFYAHQVVERLTVEEKDGKFYNNSQELVTAPIYVLQPINGVSVEPKDYLAVGYVRTHPHTAIATMFIESLEPIEESWHKFSVKNEGNYELLKNFQENFTIDDIVSELTAGVTNIYDSEEILYSVLLAYLCPRRFYFNGRVLRGWLNVALLGDSGTGKSQTYVRLANFLNLGDTFSSLSGSRTGLLYAVKQHAGEWLVSVGRYVQANGRVLAIDEAQEMPPDELKKMAIAMDTGFLSVERVASGGYTTETRTIFMMNPKTARGKAATITDFASGCDSLKNCCDPMFIRRLDLVVFTMCSQQFDKYNQKVVSTGNLPMRITPKMLRSLIFWAWTRKVDDVKWDDDAIDTCLRASTSLSAVYGYTDDTPIVSPQDFREKLARLAVAYAVLDRSFSNDLERLIVKSTHVCAVAKLLDLVYSSPACNLKQKSLNARKKVVLEDFERIKTAFEAALANARHVAGAMYSTDDLFLQMLLLLEHQESIRKSDLIDQLAVSGRWAQNKLAILQSLSLVEPTKWGYARTRKLILFLNKWREDAVIAEKFNGAFTRLGTQLRLDDDPRNWNNDGCSESDDLRDPTVPHKDDIHEFSNPFERV